MTALQIGYNAALEAWHDPGAFTRERTDLSDYYTLLWAYYLDRSSIVYSASRIAALKAAGRVVYTHTRLIYNPVPAVVRFYVDHLYPHAPQTLESGATLATPVEEGTDEALMEAIAQVDQWGNWLSEALRLVRFGASTGSVGVEVDDDLVGEKVAHRILWPSLVDSVKLDAAGNVKEYALQYQAYDEEKREHYTFRKEVDGEEFRYLRNDKPFDPPEREGDQTRSSTGVYENPYGFCPAVWIRHEDDGSERGLPAVVNITKIDEINSLVSHRHDHQHKAIEAGKVISTDGTIMPVTGASGSSAEGKAGGISTTAYDSRTDWMLLKMPMGGSVADLGSSFDLSKGDPDVTRLLESFTADYPELQAAKLIEEHGATSGEALKYKLGKAQSKLDQAAAQYSQQVIKLKQMQIAIAGWRANGGGWSRRDVQREVFRPFGLESYAAGDLNFALRRSLLVQELESEGEDLAMKRAERAVLLGERVDDLEFLMVAGYTEEKAKEIIARRGERKEPVVVAPAVPQVPEVPE